MKSGKTILLLVTALLLVGATVVWALPQSKPAPKAPTKVAMSHGTIVSFTATSLTLSHAVKGKKVETTFVLNPETKQEGTLANGAEATVHYRVVNKENVATMVKVHAPKAAAAPKSASSKPAAAPKSSKPKY